MNRTTDKTIDNIVYDINKYYNTIYLEYKPSYIDKKAYAIMRQRDLTRKEIHPLYKGSKSDVYKFLSGLLISLRMYENDKLISTNEVAPANSSTHTKTSNNNLVDSMKKLCYITDK